MRGEQGKGGRGAMAPEARGGWDEGAERCGLLQHQLAAACPKLRRNLEGGFRLKIPANFLVCFRSASFRCALPLATVSRALAF